MKKIMIFSLLFSLAACRGNSEQKVVDPVVEFDSAFCERLMPGLGGGITGGDGSISIDLKDGDRKSTRLNSSHIEESRMPSSA